MKAISILYLGSISGTSLDRANAFRRLGHRVDHMDLRELLPKTGWVDRVTWKLGGDWFSPWLMRVLPEKLAAKRYDLCHVDGGVWVTPRVIALLRKYARSIINYSIDDPLGPRDGARSKAYRQSLPFYDLCVVMRPQNVAEARSLGAKEVLRVYMSADEVSHAPRPLTQEDRRRWGADVLFIGTWFPERGPFLLQLAKLGIPLTIRGANWNKAPEWPRLKQYWNGGQIQGDDYAKAIQCARVNLGLLSKGNRDMHTTRSLEIPALGALLCAERTSEHIAMYEEGKEALFWESTDECAAMCRSAMEDEDRRQAIAAAGHSRVMANGHYNEMVLGEIISKAMAFLEHRGQSAKPG
jgi:spore maturation protein CgeB